MGLNPGLTNSLVGTTNVTVTDVNGNPENPAVGFAIPPFDNITVNYTDATKALISSVVYKLAAATVATITVTYPSGTQEVYTKS